MDKLFAHPLARVMIPAFRAFVRYAPPSRTKNYLWNRWIDPYLAWRDHSFLTDTQAGKMHGRTDDILQQYLYYFGIWEPEATAFLIERLQPGDCFIDVGANIGYFSLLAAKYVGRSGRVVAIEASPTVFAELRANLQINRRNIRAVPVAASDHPGQLRIGSAEPGNCGASTTIDPVDGVDVSAEPLATILTPSELKTARLIKIDVEGAEAAVLEGLSPVVDQLPEQCEFLVEIHPELLTKAERSDDDVYRWFQSHGYSPYLLSTDYEALAYLWPNKPARPQRLTERPTWDSNVIFSRIDAGEL